MMRVFYQCALLTLFGILTACSQDTPPPATATQTNAQNSVQANEPVKADLQTDQTSQADVVDNKNETLTTSNQASDTPKPVSDDFMQIDSQAQQLSADTGQKRYETSCQVCHSQGLLNAPKFGDKDAWQLRLAQGREVLFKHSANGFNSMPAQVTSEVSAPEVLLAVDYMIKQVS